MMAAVGGNGPWSTCLESGRATEVELRESTSTAPPKGARSRRRFLPNGRRPLTRRGSGCDLLRQLRSRTPSSTSLVAGWCAPGLPVRNTLRARRALAPLPSPRSRSPPPSKVSLRGPKVLTVVEAALDLAPSGTKGSSFFPLSASPKDELPYGGRMSNRLHYLTRARASPSPLADDLLSESHVNVSRPSSSVAACESLSPHHDHDGNGHDDGHDESKVTEGAEGAEVSSSSVALRGASIDFRPHDGRRNPSHRLTLTLGATPCPCQVHWFPTQVHWFPRHVSELDLVANRTLDARTDLEADHPGFHDADYRERRAKLAKAALNHRMHHEIPRTEYSKEEVETWGVVWDKMEDLWDKVNARDRACPVEMYMLDCRSNVRFSMGYAQYACNCKEYKEIGLASLGASEEDIVKLARCYWHSVEFGLCREDGKNKAYGAGLLSSFGELEYSCEVRPWDPAAAAVQGFPITTYQPTYFLAESLRDAKAKMRKYCEDLPRPFFALYNAQTETVHIDRPVRRAVGVPGE
ncbi:hypothetical protein ACHAWF_015595 [Thalassiosira exigua]